jgi:hypothetical protein
MNDLEENQESISGYNFCSIGGIICGVCQYPVCCNVCPVRAILDHEKGNKEHGNKTSLDDRRSLGVAFEKYAARLANDIVTKLPNRIEARMIVCREIESATTFPYCSECSTLVVDARLHKNKLHATYCHGTQVGHASKYWKKKQPKVILANFDVYDHNNYCPKVWEKIQLELHKQKKVLPQLNIGTQMLQDILSKQNLVFEQTEELVCRIDHSKSPDLWILRAGWDEYLCGYNASDIHGASKLVDDNDGRNETSILKKFSNNFIEMVQQLRKVPSSHQMFYEIERRPFAIYPNAPYRLSRDDTYEKYVAIIISMLRVVIRVWKYQSNLNASMVRKYPKIQFTDRQKKRYNRFMMIPTINKNVLS